jgi:hypothetical protein
LELLYLKAVAFSPPRHPADEQYCGHCDKVHRRHRHPGAVREQAGEFAVDNLLRCIRPHRVGTMNIFLAVAFVCLVLLLSIVIWSIKRHRDPKLHIECDSTIDELIPEYRGSLW